MEDNSRKRLYDKLSESYNLGTFEEFDSKMGNDSSRRALYDKVTEKYNIGTFEEFNAKMGNTHKQNLDAFNTEYGSFMNDFESRDSAETKMSRAGMSSGLVVPAEGSITGEERQKYLELHKQEEALKRAWYNSPDYLAQKDADALLIARMRDEIDRGRLAFAQNNPVIEGYNPSATRGAEADVELQLFETASRIIDDTIKLHNAPSRYDGANAWQNVKKFAKGTGDTLSDVDFWTSGLTEIADNLGVRNVLQKVQKELGNLNNLDEATIEDILSPAEKAVLQAWALNAQEQLNRSGDLSRGYQAGQGATESLGFMAEFALTGGVGKAASEGVETMAKWLGRKVLGQMDDAAAATVREMGEKIAKSTVGKYGARLADALAETAGRTLVMPSTFRNISEKAAEIQEDAEGNRYLTRMNDAFAKGFADSFIENLSEGGRVNAIGDLIGDVAGKIPAYKKIVDKFANSKAGELLTAFNSSGIMNTLRAGGWHGFGEEYLEEWYGNALRTITGLDKDALKDFATVDNQLITITSFLPMTIFGGTVSTAQVLSAKKGLDKKAEMLRSALLERGYDEKQADNMIDMMRGASPAEISQTLTPIVNSVALRDLNEAAALMKPVGEFAEAVRRWQSFDTKYQYQEQEQRDNLRTQMTDTLGQFWQEDENGRQTVQRGVNANGEVVYLLGKPTAEDAQSGMPQQVAAITSEGRKVFVDPSAVQLEEELEMNDFLGTEIMAEKGNKEQARMIEEKQRALAQVRQMSAPGTTVNLGTTEAPIVGTIAQRTPDGVVITMEDGSARQVSYEELGNYVGVNTTPLTDAQMDERDADALSADRAQREAELDMEYENLGSSEDELIEAEAEVEQAVEAATPLPTKADGSVDQTALWNEDPARWAQWNDEQRQDGGMNSLAYINGAIANESAKIAEMQAGYDAITDFDERDALEQEVAAVRERLQTLVDLRDKYSVQAEVAAQAQQANAVAQMTEEEKAEAEEQRREPLRKKAQEWSSRLGVKVNIAESLSDVKEEQAREQILRIDVSGSKERATGWFNPTTGEVTIYLPHTTDSSEIEKTIVHEVVAHKGLRGLLGQEGFNVLCDSVWEMMSEEERQKYLAYPGVNGNKRAAADEYIAHYAETMNLEESKPVWDRIMDLIVRILNSMGVRLDMSREQLSDIIVASYQKLVNEAESAIQDAADTMKNRLTDANGTETTQISDLPASSEVYNRHTTDKQSAETAEASQATELSGTQSTSSMNAPTSSEGKVTNNIEADNIEEEINPAFVEAISTDVDEAEYAQFLDGKAFADPQPVDGIQSDDVRFSIVKEDEIRGNTQAYFDKHYKGGKLGKKDQKLVPLNITHFTQELLDAANAQIEEMRKHMLPFLDMESKGKRFLPAEVYGKSTLFDNSSYGKTMENTLICTRTLAYIDFVEEVKKRIGRPLTATESFLASQMLYDIAIDPQCLYCYVSLDRKAYDEFLLRYTQQRDEVISKWNASDKSAEAKEQLYKEFLDGRKPTSQMQARFESWLLLAEGDNAITTADLATKARRGELKIAEVPEAWEKARSKYKKLKGEKKLAYAASEEYQTALWNYLASPLGQVTDAEAYAQSASWAKKEEDYRSYTGELLNCTADALKGLMGHYGLRFYSFSEYSPAFILENMQMVRDAAARGLKGFAYTKEADFIRIFAPTGMNINCSVYGRVDSEGNVVPDTKQGADWAQVQALREQYPNVGAVFVATNDAMVEWALNQPWIDVIIPFHIVRTGADIAKFYEWTNYTSMSADTTPSGKSTYVYPHEHHNDKETFLKIAQERGLSPRFADVKLSDGRSIVEHENYMRLVNETRRSVDETPILTPTFNVDAAKESFDAFVEKGGYYSGYFYEDEAFEQGIETVVEDIKAGKTAKDVEYGRQDVPIDVAKIMAKRAEQERKHGKGPVDILEEAKNAAINDVMFRFVGEQAAARLDSAVNATMFMDNLQTAREMEDAGADARVIKRSTGWERGADGKWRLEMPDFEIKAKPGKKKTFKLQDLITDSTLFVEYPQMKDVKVRYKKMASGLMGQLTEENGKPLVEMNDIQFQALNPRYVEAIEAFSQKYPELAEKIGKGGGRGITAEEKKTFIEEVGEILLRQGPYLDLIGGRNTLAHELQHLIQQIEGFAEGGNSDMVDTTDPAIAKENEELKNLIRAEMLAADSMVPELNDLVSQIRAKRAQGIINKRLEDEYNQKRAEWLVHKDNYNRLRKERAKLRRIGNEGYNRLAGEVEARNVEERIKLTDEQRRESLYSDTQDVATEDQIFLRGNLMTTAPLQKSEVSFRITPEMDKAYMDAVEAGDMETAQKMVIEAARLAMPNTKVVDKNGNPRVVYHQTNAKIYVNRETGQNWDDLNWKEKMEWDERDDWEDYWEEQDFSTFSRINARTTNEFDGFFFAPKFDEYHEYGDRTIAAFVNITNPASREDYNIDSTQNDAGRKERIRLQEAGFDGVIRMDGEEVDEYIAFEPSQIKSADPVTYDNEGKVIPLSERFNPENEDIRFRTSNDNQAIFVSNAAKAVEGIKMEKATPEQWLKMIEKNGGLKSGEDKWMGLSDWLKASDKKTLTKDEVLAFINENMIVIEEQHYSDEEVTAESSKLLTDMYPGWDEAFSFDWDNYMEEPYANIWDNETAVELYNNNHEDQIELDEDGEFEDMEAEEKVAEFGKELAEIYYGSKVEVRSIHGTRSGYTTRGLRNNREIALTVPTIESWGKSDIIHFGDAGEGRAIAWIRFGETDYRPADIADEITALDNAIFDYEGDLSDEEFKALVAKKHTLLRASRAQKVLVIDEIQSNRHQEGREKGYTDTERLNELIARQKQIDEEIEALAKDVLDGNRSAKRKQNLLFKERRELDWAIAEVKRKGIPAAPFEKNWQELAMKRMLRYAAENGYDIIAWTTGDQQANRYDLSRDVLKISAYKPNAEGEKIVTIYYRDEYNDYKTLIVNRDGKVIQGDYNGSALADVVGKEVALQIMNTEDVTEFEGDGLKIGGEGMRGFYDRMLPAFMNKYGKKWGIKVEDINLPNLGKSGYTMHSVPVTEEMKASVMEGQVMFRTTEITPEVRDEMDIISATALINGNYMKAPNGADTNLTAEQWAMVRTKNFKKWFGDWENDPENASKVVDENGEPKVVFHGGAWRPLLEEKGNAVFKMRGGLMGKGAYFTDKLSTAIDYAREKYGWEHDEEVSDEFLDDNGYVTEVFLNIRNENNIREYYGETYYLATNHGQIKSAIANTGEFSLNFDIRFRVNENPTEAQKEAGNYKMGHLNLDGYRITIENPKGSVRRGTDSKGNAWENTLNNDYGYIRGTEGVDGDHIDVYLSENPSEGNVFVVDQVNPETREFDEHKVMYGFNSAEEAREAYLANFSEGWNGLGTITEVTKDEFKKWIHSSHRKTKPFSEYKSVKAIGAQSEGEEMEDYLLPSSGTPTDEVVANGLDLTPAQTAELAGNIFAALPEESRKKITEGLSSIFDIQDAIMQIPTSLAMKEKWNDEDRQMADIVAEQLTKMAGEMTRPFSASEGLWVLYNALNPISEYDIVSQASRALVQRNLGFDQQTLAQEQQAREDVRFRTVGNASANAKAGLYNRGAANVWTRLKESFVDMNASVEELVNAIEKASGKKAEGFENVLLALNQQSSKGLAAMESYEQKFLNKMLNEIRAIMDETDFKYEDIVRYVILKHGLERNDKMAKRDAREYWNNFFEKVSSMMKGKTHAELVVALSVAKQKVQDIETDLANATGAKKQRLEEQLIEAKTNVEIVELALRGDEKSNEQDLKAKMDAIDAGTEAKYLELRNKDYSGITSMFYNQLDVNRKDFNTEEEYQAAVMKAKQDKYKTLADVEAAAQSEVDNFENLVSTADLWKSINNATKETLRQQYEANMISKDQYLNLRDMFEYYVPLRGFADNTAEDMYTYYRRPNSTGYTKPILAAEGRKTEAESPFGWIAAMAGSAIASNVKNEAKLALYYFVANRPDNGIATLSRTWFVHTPGDVDANGKKIFRPAYPPFNEDLSTDAAKQAYEDWQEQMKDLQKQGLAYESGQKLNLGDAVVNISDKNKPEHIVNVKIGGKDYTIIINGNPRAAQAINGDLNIEATSQDYGAIFGPVLRWMSSVNTSYNPEFWITNMMRDMAFTWMAVNIKGDPVYRRRFSDNYAKAFRVIRMAAKNEKGTLRNSYLEQMYQEFVKYGGVTGYTQIKDNETWEKEIENYLSSNDPERIKNGKIMKGVKDFFHGAHRFGESLEQVSRFAAFLTAREMGKSINEAIDDAKEITVNFNRKGSGKMITLAEARHLTGRNGRPLSKPAQWAAVAASAISPFGRRFIMFFNAAIQGLNATYKLWKKNPSRFVGWTLAYATLGAMNAVVHALADDDDDYLDIPQYERRTNLMLGFNGTYIKWALPQEARAFYALGDLAVESIMGRNPHQNIAVEAGKIVAEILPINPTEGWRALLPSAFIPAAELIVNEDYKGDPIYNKQKWLSKEERSRTAKWSSAYQGTGKLYVWIAQGLNYATGGDKYDAGRVNLQPEKMEHIVQSAFGGTIKTVDKFISTLISLIDPEEPWTVRQTPFLNRILTINDERFRNVHVNDVYEHYEAEAQHALTLEKKYKKDNDNKALRELRESEEYQYAKIYSKYKKSVSKIQEKIKVADGTAERMDLMKQQDELKRRMIKEISELP